MSAAPVKVACLLPVDHFHAPVVVSRLAAAEGVDLFCLLTPKLPGGGLRQVITESGWSYVASMAGMKAGFQLHSLKESLAGPPPGGKRYLGVLDALRLHGVPHRVVADVNAAEAEGALREFGPDLLVSVFFNQIIRKNIRALAPQAVNVHPSFLPRYRGVSPAFWMVRDGASSAGATVHRLTARLDAGEILLRGEFEVTPGMTVFEIYRRAAELAAAMLAENVRALAEGTLPAVSIDGETPSKYGKITPEAMREFREAGGRFFRLGRPLREPPG